MKQLIKENYKSIIKRGLITEVTTFKEFTDKIQEELNELIEEGLIGYGRNEELADVVLTCLNMAHHYGIDIEKEMIRKISINKTRLN